MSLHDPDRLKLCILLVMLQSCIEPGCVLLTVDLLVTMDEHKQRRLLGIQDMAEDILKGPAGDFFSKTKCTIRSFNEMISVDPGKTQMYQPVTLDCPNTFQVDCCPNIVKSSYQAAELVLKGYLPTGTTVKARGAGKVLNVQSEEPVPIPQEERMFTLKVQLCVAGIKGYSLNPKC